MILLSNFLFALAQILNLILNAYLFILIARVIVSWIGGDPYNPLVRFICSATDPLLYKVRRKIPFNTGSLDLSPIILVAIIYFFQLFLVQSVADYAVSLKSSATSQRIIEKFNESAR